MRNWYPGERQLLDVLLRLPWIKWRVLAYLVRKGWLKLAPNGDEAR